MASLAISIMDEFLQKALERSALPDVAVFAKRARGDMESAAALAIGLLVSSGVDLAKAAARVAAPEIGVMIETSAERAVAGLYRSMEHDTAAMFNKNWGALEAIPNEAVGHFAMWVFEDGSSWVSFKNHAREMAYDALMSSEFERREQVGKALWVMWEREAAPLAMQIGAKFISAKQAKRDLVALSPGESKAILEGLSKGWSDGLGWGKGLTMKIQVSGASMTPADFLKVGIKALDRGMDEAEKAGAKRMDEIRKEREARMKIHWRDAVCQMLMQKEAVGLYDAGFAAFMMSKPGLFGQHPLSVWKKLFLEIIGLFKDLPEGETPELILIESAAAVLGSDIAKQMPHFMYRYHRSGGARMTAKRVLEQTRERMSKDAAKQGLAAAVKTRDPISDEMRESSKAASSVEFSTQYGAALALFAALWAKETGFDNLAIQARAVIKTMRGAGDISMECFGWFARLALEFGEGFVSKEEIAKTLDKEMQEAAREAEDEKRKGGKIAIENEWSGNWGSELSGRKVREYLGLERNQKASELACVWPKPVDESVKK